MLIILNDNSIHDSAGIPVKLIELFGTPGQSAVTFQAFILSENSFTGDSRLQSEAKLIQQAD